MLPPDKDDPFRPVNWRWARATWLRETGRYFKFGTDDEETAVIKRYQLYLSRCKIDLDLYYVRRKFPGLYWADQIYQRYQTNKTRWAIEARLLAQESLADIAKKCGVTEDTVSWYEKAFFNVIPKINNPDYIALTVIGSKVHEGLWERDHDILWKLLGYKGGPSVLDMTINPFGPPKHAAGPEQVKASRSDIIKDLHTHKAIIAAATWPTAFAQRDIMEMWLKMLEIEKSGGSDTQSMIMSNISAAISALPFSTSQLPVAQESLKYYDGQQAELRADELLMVAAGKDSQELRDAVANKIPTEAKDGG